MILTRSTEYAIELLLSLYSKDRNKFYRLNRIADETGLPFHYLSKISHKLTEEGILKSSRGPLGGVALAIAPESISLYDIVSIIESDKIFTECLIRLKKCCTADPCQVHAKWNPIQNQMIKFFKGTTIEHIMNNDKAQNKRVINEPN
ncbi:MAG: RrF2 family transcriptional regulator [Fidelibacterota bacterium]